MNSNIEKLFLEEVREKKRTASGVHHKTGKNGYTGTILFPHSLLKGKALKEYKGTGKVKVWDMYENIISYDEFKELSQDDKKRHLKGYRERFSNKEIISHWRIGVNTLYALVKELELPAQKRGGYKGKKGKKATNNKAVAITNSKAENKDHTPQLSLLQQDFNEFKQSQPQEQAQEKANGMSFNFNGEYTAEEIIKKLEKLELLLDSEPAKFKIELCVKELQD